MNYAVINCQFCEEFIAYSALREAVYWAPDVHTEGNFWHKFWSEGGSGDFEDVIFAHRLCWKKLSETVRRQIRDAANSKFLPRTMAQLA